MADQGTAWSCLLLSLDATKAFPISQAMLAVIYLPRQLIGLPQSSASTWATIQSLAISRLRECDTGVIHFLDDIVFLVADAEAAT
jgi:hypothetical protein